MLRHRPPFATRSGSSCRAETAAFLTYPRFDKLKTASVGPHNQLSGDEILQVFVPTVYFFKLIGVQNTELCGLGSTFSQPLKKRPPSREGASRGSCSIILGSESNIGKLGTVA